MKIKLALISILLVFASSIYGMSIREDADVNAIYKYGYTDLMEAAAWGYNEKAEKLIEEGTNVNLQNTDDYTALIYATTNGHNEIVKKLIKAGANVNLQDKFFGNTALIGAASYRCGIWWGHSEIVKQLLAAGADITIKNKKDQTVIDIAREKQNDEIVKILEDHLEKQKAAIKEYLPSVLSQITVEYLGAPSKEKAVEKEEAEVSK